MTIQQTAESSKVSPAPQDCPRIIILLLDGTWNDSDALDEPDTNIVRLREAILSSLSTQITADSTVLGRSFVDNCTSTDVLVYYDRGVGTGTALNRVFGGAFGSGLEKNVRRAYRFLVDHYRTNDRVFLFGFSRGAYTARSLLGLLSASGLLLRDKCDAVNESKVWHHYRTQPKDRFQSSRDSLALFSHAAVKVECIGVFDTVGARGIPLPFLWRENREMFEFHDVELSQLSKVNLHALAIDEHRRLFESSTWRRPNLTIMKSHTEQVWFAGAHADIGGGYVNETDVRGERLMIKRLDDITLDWMIRRVKLLCPGFPISVQAWADIFLKQSPDMPSIPPFPAFLSTAWAEQGKLHESRRTWYRAFKFAWRSIANLHYQFGRCRRQVYVSYRRHSSIIGEAVHISALERWGILAPTDWPFRCYTPPNLRLARERIRETYSDIESLRGDPLKVVDWDGEALEPSNPAHRVKVLRLVS